VDLSAAIEAGAKAVYEAMDIGQWEDATPWIQDSTRKTARTCVEAAAPYLRT
jgi:hypothetical protein